MKTRSWLYPECAFAPAVICALVCFFAFHMGWIYVVCWTVISAVFGWTTARLIYNLVKKVRSVDFYAAIVMAYAAMGFASVFIASESLVVFEIFTGLAVASAIVSAGLSVRAMKESTIADTPEDTFSRLRKSLKFAFVGDTLDGEPDLNRPLCVIDGTPRSADEAESMGYGSKASIALEYIKKIMK